MDNSVRTQQRGVPSVEIDFAFNLYQTQVNVLVDCLIETGKDPAQLLRLIAEDAQERLQNNASSASAVSSLG